MSKLEIYSIVITILFLVSEKLAGMKKYKSNAVYQVFGIVMKVFYDSFNRKKEKEK